MSSKSLHFFVVGVVLAVVDVVDVDDVVVIQPKQVTKASEDASCRSKELDEDENVIPHLQTIFK